MGPHQFWERHDEQPSNANAAQPGSPSAHKDSNQQSATGKHNGSDQKNCNDASAGRPKDKKGGGRRLTEHRVTILRDILSAVQAIDAMTGQRVVALGQLERRVDELTNMRQAVHAFENTVMKRHGHTAVNGKRTATPLEIDSCGPTPPQRMGSGGYSHLSSPLPIHTM